MGNPSSSILTIFSRLFAFVLLIWAGGLVCFYVWVTCGLKTPDVSRKVKDAIVILTGDDGRIEQGLRLFRNQAAPRLFISGVGANFSQSMPKSLQQRGLSLGFEAKNTVGNAKEVRHWVEANQIKSFYLVTSDYHMMRSLLQLWSHMPCVDMTPYPVASCNQKRPYLIFQEYHKVIFSIFIIMLEKIAG